MENLKPIQNLNPEILEEIIKDRKVRINVVKNSHLFFFSIYFPHYMRFETAPFHREMFALSENKGLKIIAIMAFRGSGKSTIMNLSCALWSILGVHQKKCVVIISRTKNQAATHFLNLQNELKNNSLLKQDLGPFEIDDVTNSALSLLLPVMKARIFIASSRQSIRGIRHGEQRPDLIICDDIEDTLTPKESMESTYKWFDEEILPLGDENTRIVMLGNLISRDCLLMRTKKNIEEGNVNGVFKAYPLIDDYGTPLWPAKYSEKKIEESKNHIHDIKTWEREFLLYVDDYELLRLNEPKDGSNDDMFNSLKFPKTPYNPNPNPKTMADYTINRPLIRDKEYLLDKMGEIMRKMLEPEPDDEEKKKKISEEIFTKIEPEHRDLPADGI